MRKSQMNFTDCTSLQRGDQIYFIGKPASLADIRQTDRIHSLSLTQTEAVAVGTPVSGSSAVHHQDKRMKEEE